MSHRPATRPEGSKTLVVSRDKNTCTEVCRQGSCSYRMRKGVRVNISRTIDNMACIPAGLVGCGRRMAMTVKSMGQGTYRVSAYKCVRLNHMNEPLLAPFAELHFVKAWTYREGHGISALLLLFRAHNRTGDLQSITG